MPSGSSIHISMKPHGSVAGSRMIGDSGHGKPGVLGADIPYLDPDHHRAPRRVGRMPGDFEQGLAEKNTTPGSSCGPNSR